MPEAFSNISLYGFDSGIGLLADNSTNEGNIFSDISMVIRPTTTSTAAIVTDGANYNSFNNIFMTFINGNNAWSRYISGDGDYNTYSNIIGLEGAVTNNVQLYTDGSNNRIYNSYFDNISYQQGAGNDILQSMTG